MLLTSGSLADSALGNVLRFRAIRHRRQGYGQTDGPNCIRVGIDIDFHERPSSCSDLYATNGEHTGSRVALHTEDGIWLFLDLPGRRSVKGTKTKRCGTDMLAARSSRRDQIAESCHSPTKCLSSVPPSHVRCLVANLATRR
jgi:hypothetical protein